MIPVWYDFSSYSNCIWTIMDNTLTKFNWHTHVRASVKQKVDYLFKDARNINDMVLETERHCHDYLVRETNLNGPVSTASP